MQNNLVDLIKEFGQPDILIDNWNKDAVGYAIWGVQDTILWDSKGLYISNKKVKSCLKNIQHAINKWKENSIDISAIGFINYNFKNILYPHLSFKNHNEDFPFLFFAKPKIIKTYKIEIVNYKNVSIKLEKDLLEYQIYEDKIKKIKNELRLGNTYQINFTNDKHYKCSNKGFDMYMHLRNVAKPKYGFYINYDKFNILSLSPELFFKKYDNKIKSYPMKGTKKRNINKDIDNQLKKELKHSIKDKAEHLMIVDLLRNDIGKIAIPGSVKVNKLYQVQSYSTVHQMISKIEAKLEKSVQEIDIIKALFPGGSVTGAPKENSMKIIDELENYSRDLYTGSIGFIKPNGDSLFNIAIRTMTMIDNLGIYPVGGGIIWDSNSKEEWDEAQLKSKIIDTNLTES